MELANLDQCRNILSKLNSICKNFHWDNASPINKHAYPNNENIPYLSDQTRPDLRMKVKWELPLEKKRYSKFQSASSLWYWD